MTIILVLLALGLGFLLGRLSLRRPKPPADTTSEAQQRVVFAAYKTLKTERNA